MTYILTIERVLLICILKIVLFTNSGNAQEFNCIIGNWYSFDSSGHYYEMYILEGDKVYFADMLSGELVSHYTYKNDTLIIYSDVKSIRYFLIDFLNPDEIKAKTYDGDFFIMHRIIEDINLKLFNSKCLKKNNMFWKDFQKRLEDNAKKIRTKSLSSNYTVLDCNI